ncbi:VC0807 family protein [Bacillus sp. DX1.1]|uniref:VC0807 family protein n=1 Tax=unclassified Bacillus (in: firmicutes) TaxID=185979 RepID=UPI002570DCA6|nr:MULTISPECIES: VC0807 family protein [unclassified Bacillus (in: firmicutes)]MDM5156435.1 VC0807 family protein [Bacillus sp. DX1.1]WJE80705.1 VC0807 family protein [Bacillus sp. DX3.1]
MKQNKKVLFDIIFYLVFPFVIWKFAKTYIDPYYAMLISSVPGILYTLYCFKKEKQFHVTGFFILITLIANTTVDLLSGSAEKMLWNDVYYHIALGLIIICTIFIKKPLMLYFAADLAVLQGYDRDESRTLYRDKQILPSLQYFTLFFGLQFIVMSCIKIYFISVFGVDGYGEMKAIMTAIGWGVSICMGAGFLLVDHKIKKVTESKESV